MPPILTQRSTVIALILLLVGGYFHFRGRHLSNDDSAMLQQGIGLLFDILAANLQWFSLLHEKNKDKISTNTTAINANADVLNQATPPTVSVLKVVPTDPPAVVPTSTAIPSTPIKP